MFREIQFAMDLPTGLAVEVVVLLVLIGIAAGLHPAAIQEGRQVNP